MNTATVARQHTPEETPWYRQFWPWVLIALPSTAVIAGIATVLIAMHDPDGLVVDDYYKAGLAINRSMKRERLAAERGMRGRLLIDRGILRLDLASAQGSGGGPVQLRLLHATRAGNDQSFQLTPSAEGGYRTDVATLPPGRWIVHVDGADWRITGDFMIPGEGVAELGSLQ